MAQGPTVRRRFGGAKLTPAVAWIIGIAVGCFLTLAFVSDATKAQLIGWLGLSGAQLASGRVWTVATSVLLFDSFLGFFFDILMLWMFVPVFERFWGTRRFVIFFAATLLAGNLVGALTGWALGGTHALVPLFGISPFIFASIAAYGVTFGQQPIQFFGVIPIKGRNLAIGMIVFVTIVVLLEQRWVFGASVYGAMGTAYLMTQGGFEPKVWWLKARRQRLKRKYKVLDGGLNNDVVRRERDKRWMN